jgi:Sulfotransferase domain
MTGRLPNFLHLGPGKAGSTWLHETLLLHPDVYLNEAKDLYFFSRYYDRGLDWYQQQFQKATARHVVVGEVSPDYLGSPEAPERIHDTLGSQVQLMVTLREPAQRAFSAYLYARKHGLAKATFRETLDAVPLMLEEGRYATLLRRYLGYFPQDALFLSYFDDLKADPQTFLDLTTDRLGVSRQVLEPDALTARLPASKARFLPLALVAQRSADWARRHDGADVVGRVKRSAIVQRALYKPLGDAAPTMSTEDATYIRELLEPEIVGVEQDFGVDLRDRWGWS